MSTRGWLAVSLAVLGALAWGAAPADAAIKQELLFSFGSPVHPLAHPNAVAVDQSNDNVVVSDNNGGAGVVDVFQPSGPQEYALAQQLPSGETPDGSFNFTGEEPAGVAVNSSDHTVYVADIEHGVVDEFKLNGSNEYKYVCQITGWYGAGNEACSPATGTVEQAFVEPDGVAVDSAGNLYVSDFGHGAVDMFDSSGLGVRQILSSQWSDIAAAGPSGLALDSMGNIYVQNYQSSVAALKVGALGEVTSQSVLDENSSFAVGVDPGLNDVYVAHRSSISAYDSLGAQIDTLTLPGLNSVGVAASATTHNVFVSDINGGNVHVFGPPTVVPDVRLAGPATAVSAGGATLHGEINPDGTSEASYYFEYGLTTAYGSTSPTPPGTGAGEGSAFVPASTELTGLQAGVTYHYRLVGTNSSGFTNESEDGTFTTANVAPEVGEVEARQITADSVVFSGQVNPENAPTRYHFEYGESEAYGQSLPEIGIGGGGKPVEALQASPANLKPNTTYHYRLVATNLAGETTGVDQTFHTLPTVSPPSTPPVVSTEPATVQGSTEATISATVSSAGLPTTWVLELGAAAGSYETRLFGSLAGETGAATLSATFTDLQPGTTYHYRVVATNAAGTTAGLDRTLTTPSAPVVLPPPPPGLLPIPVFPPVVEPPVPRHHKPVKHHKPKKRHKKHAKKAHRTHRTICGPCGVAL
jgi:sugar lactone lactonase YvrE